MLIGIDGNEANITQRVGIGQYAYQVLKHIYESQKSKVKSLASIRRSGQKYNLKFKIYLKDRPLNDLPKESDWWKYKVFGPQKLWTQIALPARLLFDNEKPDVFFSPSHYAPRFSSIPQVISIMDLSFIHYPELFTKKDLYQLRNWTKYSVYKAKKIFTISKYSKRTIIEHYKVADRKVIVTYPGYDRNKFKVQSSKFKVNNVKQKYKLTGDFILFVGTLQPRKNIERLIQAYELIKKKDLSLVLVGKTGWLYEPILERILASNKKKKIVWLKYVTDEQLSVLYNGARCFVLPSLYEGFGIPAMEAMACGCPVVVSNVSSLPEVVGDAGLLADPENTQDLAKKVYTAGYNERVRNRSISLGLQRVKLFSWEKCAKRTLAELIKSGNAYER